MIIYENQDLESDLDDNYDCDSDREDFYFNLPNWDAFYLWTFFI
jgi:hypothetical protein